jgi:Ca2+-binding RTX toxin-like protein
VATLKTTALVNVVGVAGSEQTFTIMLQNGYLDGLEFAVGLGGDPIDHLRLTGGPGGDQIHFGSSGFLFRQVDATMGGATGSVTGPILLEIQGHGGSDVLSLAGTAELPGSTIGGAYGGAASLSGDDGHDAMWDGSSANQFLGGTGRDAVFYENRTAGVNISADDFADDGTPGEFDNVASDVEVLVGGSGDDTLKPTPSQNWIADTTRVFCIFPIEWAVDRFSQVCGGPGDDTFVSSGFPFGTEFSGGSGTNDAIDASGSAFPLRITLDDRFDDGLVADALTSQARVGDDIEVILGGTHHDVLVGSDADNVILGGGGNDTIDGGPGTDMLTGGGGEDLLTFSDHSVGVDVSFDGIVNDGAPGENDVVAGFERLTGTDFDDRLEGDDGADDLIRGLGGSDQIDGLGGADDLRGGSDADVLDGGDDDDILYGHDQTTVSDAASDQLSGGDGDDDLFGGGGPDTLFGEEGFDELNGGSEDDDLFGGSQNDDFDGGSGADVIDGGSGPRDKVHYDDRTAGVTVTLGGGANDGQSGEHDDVDASVEWVFGGSGDDEIVSASRGLGGPTVDNMFSGGDGDDELKGGNGSDILNGGDGDDELRGGSAHDILRGDADEDDLFGEEGPDQLEGGTEEDVLKGEGGSDLFRAVDEDRDKVRGGSGADEAYVDEHDDVESVSIVHLVP